MSTMDGCSRTANHEDLVTYKGDATDVGKKSMPYRAHVLYGCIVDAPRTVSGRARYELGPDMMPKDVSVHNEGLKASNEPEGGCA